MPHAIQRELQNALAKTGRMLLVTGPTGSGKTTTLYTLLNLLCDGTSNIETIEDPIEYEMPGVNQIQLNEAAGMTFANSLRAILRQDPDVILVGEIRDGETANIALQAAQTGHLVLSTLHTNDALSAITRLQNLEADLFLIAHSLEGVLAQRLLRTVCPHCVQPAPAEYLQKYASFLEAEDVQAENLRIGAGCKQCRQTGYRGRVGVFSYLKITEELSEMILKKAPLAACEKIALKQGFITLQESSLYLLRQGITTIEEIYPYQTWECQA